MIFPFYCMIAMAVSTAAPNQTISTSINKSIQEDLVNFSIVQNIDEEREDLLAEELFDNRIPIQRFISPYDAAADMPHNIGEFTHASGNWLGSRDFLDAHGIEFSTTYTSDIAGNPLGGKIPGGFTYCDNFSFGCFVETEKLFGWHGGYFMLSALQRDGESLSRKNIHNQFTVQQVAGGQTFRWYELSYQQDFWKDRFSLKAGRIAALDDFEVSPLYWLYMNNAIDGNIQALPINGKMSVYPATSWGSRLKINLTSTSALRFGIYQQEIPSVNGLYWNFYSRNGIIMMGQYSWEPEFYKPADASLLGSQAGSAHKAAFRKEEKKAKGLPGHYFMGSYYSSWEYRQFNSTVTTPNAYGFYWHADQMVYRPNLFSDAGLVLWSACSLSPQQNLSLLPFEVNTGAVYTGLIPGRINDNTILGAAYGKMSSSFADAEQAAGEGTPTYELMLELGYRINLTQYVYFQPDLQYIVNPRGLGSIPNALVIGAQMGVIF